MRIPNNPLISVGKEIYKLLNPSLRKKSALILLLLIVNAFLDVVGLAAILPLISVMVNPEVIQESALLNWGYTTLGFEEEAHFLIFLASFLVLIFLIKNTFSLWVNFQEGKFSFQIAYDLCERQFKYYYEKGWLYINQDTSGRIIFKILHVPSYLAKSYIMPYLIIITEIVVLLFIFLGILFYNPTLVLILGLTLLPAIVILYRSIKTKAKNLGDERNELSPVLINYVTQAMKGYVDVRLSNKENYFLNQYLYTQDKLNYNGIMSSILNRLPSKAGEVIIVLGVLIIFLFSFILEGQREEILFILGLFAGAAYRVMPSINRIVTQLVSIKTHSFAIEELSRLVGYHAKGFDDTQRMLLQDKIEIDNISYTYPDAKVPALDRVSIELKKGESIGIVGESGSGKTTLLNIILRLLNETSGEIRVDGSRLNKENQSSFQKNIGFVKQDVFIADTSIKENIAFGEASQTVDEHEIRDILDKLKLSPFVKTLAEGIEFKLGEMGNKLSGGQRQRIGIARALYKEAEILVFDEATSALDTDTEKAIMDTIQTLAQLDKTVIIVAHRITTLKYCDRIYELEKGRIKRVCSYDELLQENIDYATNSPSNP